MSTDAHHPDAEADRTADRRTYLLILLVVFGSWIVEASSVHFEMIRLGRPRWQEPWLRELLAHLAILVAIPIIPFALSRAPIVHQTWRWAIPAHVLATLVFAFVHILLMVGLRKALYPILLGHAYGSDIDQPATWLYEYRKDVFVYFIMALGFVANRALEQRKLEAIAASDEARTGGRLTLKSGGRTIMLDAGDVIWARAAANYVEVHTDARTHLARMTLAALEGLLGDAGTSHVRVHRSWIVNLDAVEEIRPTGEGDVTIRLKNGDEIPGSRRYRERLDLAPS